MEALHPMPELDPLSLPTGSVVNGWRITGWQGRGAYGSVYRAEREHGDPAPVALKLALQAGDARFEREGALLSRIHSPHVPTLHGQGLWHHRRGTFPYVVMQWIEGVPLYTWASRSALTSRQALKLLAQAARALAETHETGGVHRDVKGDNILVRPDGHLFLTDFGAGNFRGALSLTWHVLPPGTPAYRSPEAWGFQRLFWQHPTAHYDASPCDDLFALGITAYRLVTGRYPPPTQPGEGGAEVWRPDGPGPCPPRDRNPAVCQELDALIRKLCAVCPMDRFRGSASEAFKALERAAERAGPSADAPLFGAAHAQHSYPAPGAPLPRKGDPTVPRALAWAAVTTAGLVGLALAPFAVSWLRTHQALERSEEAQDGGATALGNSGLSISGYTAEPHPGIGLPMPARPFPGQRKPPCNRKGESEIRGGCWYLLGAAKPPCGEDAVDWQGGCYVPSFPREREPTSGEP
ncbi:serine/threonine protein kinase [Stigmatella aurantiaca]|uniref:Protein kinase n=1 Tax=Stigmatella aurantiaca (strain DW4/3-1) TaxID=378806 RepID=Q08P96_STIAD|nr:serine/threonine-protein kinase [Stigmatella aurantiaca]ADO69730.1 Protein kinase [Stigmatella aurantiaca DW4/3-1]EAU62309.1 protein kinase [Stigmatella aurantiaca DW4/3-1]